MPIQPISRSTFLQLNPDHRKPTEWGQEEVEWFADRSRVLIAYIVRDTRSTAEWSIVIEGRDERGQFHPIESREHVATQQEARTVLEKRLHELIATGIKVFPRLAGTHHSD
jgi:hypothetical protein